MSFGDHDLSHLSRPARFWKVKSDSSTRRLLRRNRGSVPDVNGYGPFHEKTPIMNVEPESPDLVSPPFSPRNSQRHSDYSPYSRSSSGSFPTYASNPTMSLQSLASTSSSSGSGAGSGNFPPTQSLAQRILNDERARKTIAQLKRLEAQEEARVAVLSTMADSTVEPPSDEKIVVRDRVHSPGDRSRSLSSPPQMRAVSPRVSPLHRGLQARMAGARDDSPGILEPQELSATPSRHHSRQHSLRSLPALPETQDGSPSQSVTAPPPPLQRKFSAQDLPEALEEQNSRHQSLPSVLPPSIQLQGESTPKHCSLPPSAAAELPARSANQTPSPLHAVTGAGAGQQVQRLSRVLRPQEVSSTSPVIQTQQKPQPQQLQQPDQQLPPFKHVLTPPMPETHFELSASPSVVRRPRKTETADQAHPKPSPHPRDSNPLIYNTLPHEAFQLERPGSYDLSPRKKRTTEESQSHQEQPQDQDSLDVVNAGVAFQAISISIEPLIDPRTGRPFVESAPLKGI